VSNLPPVKPHRLRKTKIRIGNHPIRIIADPYISRTILANEGSLQPPPPYQDEEENPPGDKIYGHVDAHRLEMRIDTTVAPSLIDETIVHECIEFVLCTNPSKNIGNLEEADVEALAQAIVSAMHSMGMSFVVGAKH
jgi:hypothetical protein